jgi:hypothetical protein
VWVGTRGGWHRFDQGFFFDELYVSGGGHSGNVNSLSTGSLLPLYIFANHKNWAHKNGMHHLIKHTLGTNKIPTI